MSEDDPRIEKAHFPKRGALVMYASVVGQKKRELMSEGCLPLYVKEARVFFAGGLCGDQNKSASFVGCAAAPPRIMRDDHPPPLSPDPFFSSPKENPADPLASLPAIALDRDPRGTPLFWHKRGMCKLANAIFSPSSFLRIIDKQFGELLQQ
ncbi:hypothetical protein AVEN_199998-1 [Araneus ventricosus]|uniref:Uncharacterized protein n=1 Tax=Araneus ventricosus TaxID=182803 RepID=A0A4Y2BV14_ARAVE|nr:hypothetical protein AVEN_199998-1 [Araneus ventricosus]